MSKDDDDFQKVVMEGLVPKMANSAVAVSIVPSNEENYVDAKFCVELGVMIMLDKPIIALVQPGAKVPDKLRQVADEILEADVTTDEGRELVAVRLKEFMDRQDLA